MDMRVKVIDVPDQDAITKDNVTLNVNAVLYYLVESADKAMLTVENFAYAVSQLAQITMRDVVGEVTLDELLSNRDDILRRIKKIVDHLRTLQSINDISSDQSNTIVFAVPMEILRAMEGLKGKEKTK